MRRESRKIMDSSDKYNLNEQRQRRLICEQLKNLINRNTHTRTNKEGSKERNSNYQGKTGQWYPVRCVSLVKKCSLVFQSSIFFSCK